MGKDKRKCPKCGEITGQHSIGKTSAGSSRFRCTKCKREYTPEPKKWRYSEQDKKEAMKMLINRGTARGIAKHFGMHHSNVLRWAREEQKKRQ